MPLADVCVHLATPVSTTTNPDPDTWIEGEPDEKETLGEPVECFYMEGRGAAEEVSPRGRRKVEGPVILYESERDDGTMVVLVAEDEVIIDPADDDQLWAVLGGAGQTTPVNGTPVPGIRFQLQGDPTPFQPPGEVIGFEAQLKRVED